MSTVTAGTQPLPPEDRIVQLDIDQIRARFPGLASETSFLDNAGGSHMPMSVIDAMTSYMRTTFVQTGAHYTESIEAARVVRDAHQVVKTLMNAGPCGEVALGHSCSVMMRLLADAYADALDPARDEIVVAQVGHESNIGPWMRLKDFGYTVRPWLVDPATGESYTQALTAVLSSNTKIVAFPHVSNILGEVVDVAAITKMAHDVGARVVVDGVAYAPHRPMDVKAWGVDWYTYSCYKMYGPHVGALYGSNDAWSEISGPNHFFVPDDAIPYKFELGGACHEACAGLAALPRYLNFLAGVDETAPLRRNTVESALNLMTALELPLQKRVIDTINTHERTRIVGPDTFGPERVATISFVHSSIPSQEIAKTANEHGFGMRFGHFYSYRLCEALGLKPDDGVARVSLVHYNSPEEVERLVTFLADTM